MEGYMFKNVYLLGSKEIINWEIMDEIERNIKK